jgi:hypothetical protein
MCTCGTCSYSSAMLAIHYKSLCSILSPWDVYLWDPSPSDVGPDVLLVMCTCGAFLHLHPTYGTWQLACHLCLWTLLYPTSGIRWLACHVYLYDPSPSDLLDPTAYVSRIPVGPFSISIRPVGPDSLRVTCCCQGLINSNSKRNIETWESNPRPRARNRPSSPLC